MIERVAGQSLASLIIDRWRSPGTSGFSHARR